MSVISEFIEFLNHYQHTTFELKKYSFFKKRIAKNEQCDLSAVQKDNSNKQIVQKELSKLLEETKGTSFEIIQTVNISNNKILLNLLRSKVIKAIILEVSKEKESYGIKNLFNGKKFSISHSQGYHELTELRMEKAVEALTALVEHGGGCVVSMESEDVSRVHLCPSGRSPNHVLISPVVTVGHCTNSEYIYMRTKDILTMSDHRGLDSRNVHQLVNAVIIFDLLSVRFEKQLLLDSSDQPKSASKSNSRGATFVLYNYVRLSTILQKHAYYVNNNIYPPLSSLEDIDYALLREEDEWSLLYDLVAAWPLVVRECKDLSRPRLHRLTSFLTALAQGFSVYYHHIRVLHKGVPHMVPLTEARIHLLLTIKQVFLIGFSLLGITAPTMM